MRLIIAGSRKLNPSWRDIEELLKSREVFPSNITEVVSGTGYGVDKCGEAFANHFNIPVKQFPADWDTYGKSAGPIRNAKMAFYCDMALVIWDGKSPGSRNMIINMRKSKKPVIIAGVQDGKFRVSGEPSTIR